MTPKQRLRIAIGALNNLGKSYSFRQIADFATTAVAEKGFKRLWRGVRNPPQAFVCSTLYQDAYNFAFQGTSIRLGSLCTPAHLSASEDFEPVDPALRWLAIE
jgi:hypothetical protein